MRSWFICSGFKFHYCVRTCHVRSPLTGSRALLHSELRPGIQISGVGNLSFGAGSGHRVHIQTVNQQRRHATGVHCTDGRCNSDDQFSKWSNIVFVFRLLRVSGPYLEVFVLQPWLLWWASVSFRTGSCSVWGAVLSPACSSRGTSAPGSPPRMGLPETPPREGVQAGQVKNDPDTNTTLKHNLYSCTGTN